MILRMSFLKLSNANVLFGEKTFTWRFYIINDALFTIEWVQIINKKDIIIMALDVNSEMFVVHVAIRKQEEMAINRIRKAQIEVQYETQGQNGAQVGVFLFDKALIEVPTEYSNYNNVFLVENVAELSKNTEMNKHAIKLGEGK